MTDKAAMLSRLDQLIAGHAAVMRDLVVRGRDPVLPDYARATARARRVYESGMVDGLQAARDLLARWPEADQAPGATPAGAR